MIFFFNNKQFRENSQAVGTAEKKTDSVKKYLLPITIISANLLKIFSKSMESFAGSRYYDGIALRILRIGFVLAGALPAR